jgi:cysteine desulfurase
MANNTNNKPIYLDYAATTPVDKRVAELVMFYMIDEFGNASSHTHEYGARALKAVNHAKEQLAAVVECRPDEVLFTSGATESNNLSILGIFDHAVNSGKKHIISTQIEHKAVLEPLKEMEKRGFEVTFLPPNKDGWVEPKKVKNALKKETVMVSIMHVNNEIGVIQPIEEICEVLKGHDAYFHTDAAQGFGKELEPLKNKRIDLISISGHKIFGPKGIGALVLRRRKIKKPPLKPLMFGGKQQGKLRPGTLPTQLIAGLGLAAELAVKEHKKRKENCLKQKKELLEALKPFKPQIIGDPQRQIQHIMAIALPDIKSEAFIHATREFIAISNGSACNSSSITPSHVLAAMDLSFKPKHYIRLSLGTRDSDNFGCLKKLLLNLSQNKH